MSAATREMINLVEHLPEAEQALITEIIRRIYLAWDPDFTKVTPSEAAVIAQAEEEFKNGDSVTHSDINWD